MYLKGGNPKAETHVVAGRSKKLVANWKGGEKKRATQAHRTKRSSPQTVACLLLAGRAAHCFIDQR